MRASDELQRMTIGTDSDDGRSERLRRRNRRMPKRRSSQHRRRLQNDQHTMQGAEGTSAGDDEAALSGASKGRNLN